MADAEPKSLTAADEFSHTDGTQQVVCSLDLGAFDCHVNVFARAIAILDNQPQGGNHSVSWLIHGKVSNRAAGAAAIEEQVEVNKLDGGAKGYAATLTVSGNAVRVEITAANTVISRAHIDALVVGVSVAAPA